MRSLSRIHPIGWRDEDLGEKVGVDVAGRGGGPSSALLWRDEDLI